MEPDSTKPPDFTPQERCDACKLSSGLYTHNVANCPPPPHTHIRVFVRDVYQVVFFKNFNIKLCSSTKLCLIINSCNCVLWEVNLESQDIMIAMHTQARLYLEKLELLHPCCVLSTVLFLRDFLTTW